MIKVYKNFLSKEELKNMMSQHGQYEQMFFKTHFQQLELNLSELLNHPIKISQSAKDFFINAHKFNNIPIQYTHQECVLRLKRYKISLLFDFQKKMC